MGKGSKAKVLILKYVTLDHKIVAKFVAIVNKTLYGSKLLIFLLWQKSLGY